MNVNANFSDFNFSTVSVLAFVNRLPVAKFILWFWFKCYIIIYNYLNICHINLLTFIWDFGI